MSSKARAIDINATPNPVASSLPDIAAALSAHEVDIDRAESALQLCVQYAFDNPQTMRQHVDVWLLPALGLLLNPHPHSSANIVDTLSNTLNTLAPLDPTLPNTLERHMRDNDTLNKMMLLIQSKSTTTSTITTTTSGMHPGVRAIKAWGLYVGLLGRNMLHVSLANNVLKVAEKAFVAEDVTLRASAHDSWLALVCNFRANNMLSHPKRVRLLVEPAKNCLASNGCKSEVVSTACLRTWKELLTLLPNNMLREHYHMVFTPLLDALVRRRRDNRAIAPNAIVTMLDTLCEFVTFGCVANSDASEQQHNNPTHAAWIVNNTPYIFEHLEGLRGDDTLDVESAIHRVFVATAEVVAHAIKGNEEANAAEGGKLHEAVMHAILAHIATLSTSKAGVCTWNNTKFMLDLFHDELDSNRFMLDPLSINKGYQFRAAQQGGNVVTLRECLLCVWMHHAACGSHNEEDMQQLRVLVSPHASHVSIHFVAELVPWQRYQARHADIALWAWLLFAEQVANQLDKHAAEGISTASSVKDIAQSLDILCVPVCQLAKGQTHPTWDAHNHIQLWVRLFCASDRLCTDVTFPTRIFIRGLCSKLESISKEAADIKLRAECIIFVAECILELIKGEKVPFLQLPSADIAPARAIAQLLGALLMHARADIAAAGVDIRLARLNEGATRLTEAVSALLRRTHSQADALMPILQDVAQALATWLSMTAVRPNPANTTSMYKKVSPALRERVREAWVDVIHMLHTHSQNSFDSTLLDALAHALKEALTHTDTVIVNQTVELWNATFAQAKALQHNWFPSFLASLSVPLQAPAAAISPPAAAISPPPQAEASFVSATVKPSSSVSSTAAAKSTPKSAKKSDIGQETATFVAIPARPKTKKKVLTEHQREVRRQQLSSKPALYTKLDGPSQPAWGLDSQSQDCSQSQAAAEVSVSLSAPKRVQLVQCDNNANMVVDTNIAKESSPPLTDADAKATHSPKRAHEHTYTTHVPERKRVKIVVEEETMSREDCTNNKPHTNSWSEHANGSEAPTSDAAEGNVGSMPCCGVVVVAPEASLGEPTSALALACLASEPHATSPNAVGDAPIAEATNNGHNDDDDNNNNNNIEDHAINTGTNNNCDDNKDNEADPPNNNSHHNDNNNYDNNRDDNNINSHNNNHHNNNNNSSNNNNNDYNNNNDKQLVEAHAAGVGSLILSLPPDTPLVLLRRLSACLTDDNINNNINNNKSLSPGLTAQELWDAQECLGEMSRCVAAALRRMSTS